MPCINPTIMSILSEEGSGFNAFGRVLNGALIHEDGESFIMGFGDNTYKLTYIKIINHSNLTNKKLITITNGLAPFTEELFNDGVFDNYILSFEYTVPEFEIKDGIKRIKWSAKIKFDTPLTLVTCCRLINELDTFIKITLTFN